MAHLYAFATSMTYGPSAGQATISGQAYTSDMGVPADFIPWEATVALTATTATQNSACIAAAELAVENESHNVGVLDNRTLLAGAVGL